jgi:ATP-dependent exoDNAse (exonuclease V) beta subunit
MREEEMRLLYVAMTRAKNTLYVMAEYTNDENAVLPADHPVDVFGCTNYFKMFAANDFESRVCSELNKTLKSREVRQVLVGEEDEFMAAQIEGNLTFEYPHKSSSSLSVKRSVTQAAHFKEEDGIHFERSAIYGESDTETGNAYHKFLELCDFSLDPKDAINGVIGGLLISKEHKDLLDKGKLERILQMPIFKMLEGYTLYKEQPFTAFIPATIVEEDYNGSEQILVQGIIDLIVEDEDGFILIDYKLSKIEEDIDIVKKYSKQLSLYKSAIEKCMNKPVKKVYIINILQEKIIELNGI